MFRKFFLTLSLCFLLNLLLNLAAQARRAPDQDWRSYDTPHFTLIYPEAAAQAAAAVADLAERYYPRTKEMFGYAPAGRTPVVLNTQKDLANGFAQSIFTKLEFYLAPPDDKGFGPREKSWLESLTTHEYAHLCSGMQDKQGLAYWVSCLFGNIQGVNFVAPEWWVEGAAIYAETELTQAGRGVNPYERMRLAANLLSDHPWNFSQIGVATPYHLPWDRPYLPGYYILKQAESAKQDPEFLAKILDRQSAWPVFGLGWAWHQALGIWPEEIWESLSQRPGPEWLKAFGPERQSLPQARRLTQGKDRQFSHPRWLSIDTLLAYSTGVEAADELVSIAVSSGRVETIGHPDRLLGSLACQASGPRIYYAKVRQDPLYTDTEIADIFYCSPLGEEHRLTNQGRCWSPDVSGDGKVVCVVNHLGVSRLGLISKNGKVDLVPGPEGVLYLSPRWSPDGKKLAAAVRWGGHQDVCLVDPASGGLTALTHWDEDGDFDPDWSPDGKTLFWVSDRSGTHQIYAYRLEDQKLFRVTDARLGAFDPAISPDNRFLAYAEYMPGNCQQVVVAPLNPSQWQAVDLLPPGPLPQTPPELLLPPLQGRPYAAAGYLAPSFWLPMLAETNGEYMFGAVSERRDPLEYHTWLAQAYYHPIQDAWFGSLEYANDETFLTLSAKALTWPLLRQGTVPGGTTYQNFRGRKSGGEIRGTLPLDLYTGNECNAQIQLDLAYQAFAISMQSGEVLDPHYAGLDSGVWFAVVQQGVLDLFPELGCMLNLQGQAALPGHAYDGRAALASLEVYWPSLLPHQAWVAGISGRSQIGLSPETTYATFPDQSIDWPRAEYGATLTLGYRLPLWYIDNGFALFPWYFQSLGLESFYRWGTDDLHSPSLQEWQAKMEHAVEITLPLKITVFWYVPITFKPYVQYQIDSQGLELGVQSQLNINF